MNSREREADLDRSVIGRLLAAQDLVHVFDSRKQLGEFPSPVVKTIPGVSEGRFCFEGVVYPEEEAPALFCGECPFGPPGDGYGELPVGKNRLLGRLPMSASQSVRGCLLVEQTCECAIGPYLPLLQNLSNTVALTVENKKLKSALENSGGQYRRLLEFSNAAPWEMDWGRDWSFHIGSRIEKMLGYPARSWKNFDVFVRRVHPDDRQSRSLSAPGSAKNWTGTKQWPWELKNTWKSRSACSSWPAR